MKLRPGVPALVFCLAFVWAEAATAQNTVAWTTNYYSVTGATLPELHAALARSRPGRETNDMDGETVWRVEWKFTTQAAANGCRCVSFTTRTTIATTLPRWTPPTNALPAVREAWTRYLAALGQHEAGHAQFALTTAPELRRRVAELATAPDCAALEKSLNALGRQVIDDFRRREREYDERTRHGATQGAVLPRGERPGERRRRDELPGR